MPRSLNFTMPGGAELGGWTVPLVNLRWLSVAAPAITVMDDLGEMQKLQYMHLATSAGDEVAGEGEGPDTLVFGEGCIPGKEEGLPRG